MDPSETSSFNILFIVLDYQRMFSQREEVYLKERVDKIIGLAPFSARVTSAALIINGLYLL